MPTLEEILNKKYGPPGQVLVEPQEPLGPPEPPTPLDPIEAHFAAKDAQPAIDAQDTAREAQILQFQAEQATMPPGKAAEVAKWAALTPEADVRYVADHLDEVKARALARNLDMEHIVKHHPVLAKYIGDPKTAAQTIDDSATLKGLEAAITGKWEAIKDDGEQQDEFDLAGNAVRSNVRLVTPPAWASAVRDAFTKDVPLMYEQAKEFLGLGDQTVRFIHGMPTSFQQMRPEELEDRKKRMELYRQEGTGNKDYLGPETQGIQRTVANAFLFPFKISPMLLGTAATAGVGGAAGPVLGASAEMGKFAGLFAFNTVYTAPGMYEKLSSLESPNGEKISPTAARVATVIGAPLAGWVLSKGLSGTLLGTTEKALESAGARTVQSALADQSVLRSLTEFGARWGAHTVEGAVGFAMAGGMEASVEVLTRAWVLGDRMEHPTDLVYAAMWNNFKQGLADMMVLSAWGAGRDLVRDFGRMKRANETALRLRVMVDAQEAAKHPALAGELAAETKAQPGSATHIFVDRDVFDATARQGGFDPREMASEIMGDGGKAYVEASTSGAPDVAIPIEKVSKKLNTRFKGLSDMLVAEGRFHPDDMSIAKLAKEVERWTKLAQETADLPVEKMDEEVKAIYDTEYKKALGPLKENPGLAVSAEGLADSHARTVIGVVSSFRERSGATEPLIAWYDKTFGRMGIWSAKINVRVAQTLQEKYPSGAQVSFQKPDGVWAPGKVIGWKADGTVRIINETTGQAFVLAADALHPADAVQAVRKLVVGPEVEIDSFTRDQLVNQVLGGLKTPGAWGGVAFSRHGEGKWVEPKLEWAEKSGAVQGKKIYAEKTGRMEISERNDGKFVLYEISKESGGRMYAGTYDTQKAAEKGAAEYLKYEEQGPLKHTILLRSDVDQYNTILAHEFAHTFGRVLDDLAQHGQLRDLHDQLAEALGYKPDQGKTAGEVRSARHDLVREERMAHAFEQYLMEGKAPSIALSPVFSKFMYWGAKLAKTSGMDVSTFAVDRLFNRFPNAQQKFEQGIYAGPAAAGGKGPDVTVRDQIMNQKLREIFAKMLTTTEEVEKAEQLVRAGLPFAEAIKNMSPKEQEAYAKLVADLPKSAQEVLLKRIVDATREENSKFLRDELERFKRQVTYEMSNDPTYNLIHFMRTGKLLLEHPQAKVREELLTAPNGKPYRIGYDELVRRLGEPAAKELADSLRQIHSKMVTKDPAQALDLELMAEMFGFKSESMDGKAAVDYLLAGLKMALPEGEHIERAAKARLRETYQTDLVDNPEILRNRALDAVINEKMAKKVLLEMNAMGRALDPARLQRSKSIEGGELQRLAARLVLEKSLRNIRPEMYAKMISDGSIKARDFAKAGDMAKAWDQSEIVALNIHMYMEARKISDLMNTALSKLKNRMNVDSYRGKLGLADESMRFRNFNDAVLQAIGLREPTRGEQPFGPKALDEFLAAAKEKGQEANVDGWDIDTVREILSGTKNWKDLLPGEMANIFKALANLEHIAGEVNEIRIGDWKADLEKTRGEFIADLEKLPFQGKAPRDLALVGKTREGGLKLQGFDANALEPQTMFDFMGPTAKKIAWEAYKKAKYDKYDLQTLVSQKFKDAYEAIPKEIRDKWHEELPDLATELPIPEGVNLAGPASRSHLWMIMLNMGNEGNRMRLLRGMDWTADQVIKAAEKYLSVHEMNFIQKVWDISDKDLWPRVLAKERARVGLDPDKVAAMPLKLKLVDPESGLIQEHTYRGGYFPAKYDPRVSARGSVNEQQRVEDGQVRMRPSTLKNYTKGRAENYADIVNLEWSVLPSHLSEVIHDVAFDAYVRGMNRIFFDRRVRDTMYQRLGEERAKQPGAWLEVVAREHSDQAAPHMARNLGILDAFRSRVVYSALGYSVNVPLADFLHPIAVAAFGKITMYEMSKVMAQTPGGYAAMREFALANSKELNIRADHANVKLREELLIATRAGAPTAGSKVLDAVRKHAFAILDYTDRIVSTQVWTAKYREVMKSTQDHSKAVSAADDAVTSTMPTHTIAELPAMMRDKRTVGSLLLFFGYYSKLYNMSRGKAHEAWMAWNDAKTTGEYGKAIGTTAAAAARVVAGLAVASIMGDYLMGHGKEQTETWGQWWARKSLAAPFTMIPLASNAAEPIADLVVTGKMRKGSVKNAPLWAFTENVINTVGRLASDKRTSEQKTWDVIETALMLGRLPARQPRRTGEYLTGLATGSSDSPEGFWDFTGHAVYGARRRQPANPMQGISDTIKEW